MTLVAQGKVRDLFEAGEAGSCWWRPIGSARST